MTEPLIRPHETSSLDSGITLLELAGVLLSRRRMIVTLGVIGASLGLAMGLTSPRLYVASATFIPQGSEGGASSLSLAASQFGVRIPTAGGSAWGAPVYVQLLRSRTLLEAIAMDTIVVAEENGRRVRVMELLGIQGANAAERGENAFQSLAGIVSATEVKAIGAVQVSAKTRWPSVSLALASRVVRGVNDFILKTRRSQATAERRFVEEQASDAERALRTAEDNLLSLMQRNRIIGSSELQFTRDRLTREVTRREQIYSSLLESREDAKIREVRDTPVITILEQPQLPVVGESRKTALRILLGGFAGVAIGVLIALLAHWMALARADVPANGEFFRQLDEFVPRIFRNRTSTITR